eukprot:NODE_265_length_11346_cov_0.635814.p4 type:complete len:239 gc:universal NODE_265_length_11346_cov_0.635814:10382-11098(+)
MMMIWFSIVMALADITVETNDYRQISCQDEFAERKVKIGNKMWKCLGINLDTKKAVRSENNLNEILEMIKDYESVLKLVRININNMNLNLEAPFDSKLFLIALKYGNGEFNNDFHLSIQNVNKTETVNYVDLTTRKLNIEKKRFQAGVNLGKYQKKGKRPRGKKNSIGFKSLAVVVSEFLNDCQTNSHQCKVFVNGQVISSLTTVAYKFYLFKKLFSSQDIEQAFQKAKPDMKDKKTQ